jgi:ATP-dependent helicase/nuclease subunit A
MTEAMTVPLADDASRRRISKDLDSTFLVEAGAGSGKTRSLVDRMIALIAAGRATIQTMAAVTFTRKAAAQLRERFQLAIERSLRDAPGEGERAWDSEERERLRAALRDLEQGFVGTIHSFCARLIRERPVECGVDPEFEELEEIDDAVFREACWHDHLADVRVRSDDLLRRLDEVGLGPADLRDAFDVLAMYPEVTDPEPGREEPPDYKAARTELERFLDWAGKAMPSEPPPSGWDDLQFLMRRLFGRRDRLGFKDPRLLMESLELLERTPKPTQKCWGGKDKALGFCEKYAEFQARVVVPALTAWREHRHALALRFLTPAVAFYDARRRERAKLNFGDQLLLAARLLRENPEVRTYFQAKIRRILVDEFQDTDPIQAEILFYLTGSNVNERDWTRLCPVAGSLFLVGDPKQSIYRFRRADIDTYNLVKRLIVAGGGEVLPLVANFRSLDRIGGYVNGVFGPKPDGNAIFPAAATETQAGFAALAIRRAALPGAANGVFKNPVPKVRGNYERPMAQADAASIAEFIVRAVAGGLSVQEKGPGGRESPRPARAGDFLVLFRYKKNMDIYARALEERGIPYEITGSDAFSESPDIAAIVTLLMALVDPANPVLTVAALRGIFFGVSDQDLLDHRAAGGSLEFAGLKPPIGPASEPVRRALVALREWWSFARTVPPSVVLERILEASGLLGYLVSSEMGSSRAGDVLKLVEIVRSLEAEGTTSFAAVTDFIADPARLRDVEEISLRPGRRDAVRLMNLHKAKGLEAPVVILAHPAGMKEHEPDKHIFRSGASTPRGYFLFKCLKEGEFKARLVSQPVGWADVAGRAAEYLEAEEHRLMYVAATRAMDMLVISSYADDLGPKKSWRILDDALTGEPELPLPAPSLTASAPSVGTAVSARDIAEMRRTIRERIGRASRARYRLETVTSLARSGQPAVDREIEGRGREWGTAVHSLLHALGRAWAQEPPAAGAPPVSGEELRRMAGNALAAVGLGREDEGALASLAEAILRSEFWSRALAAARKHFEVPFSIRVGPEDPDYAGLASAAPFVALGGAKPVAVAEKAPIFLAGAIDLAFFEGDGWIIADYKSDRVPEGGLDALVAHYRPQVDLYTRFWERITGEKVKETGLYFTAVDRWVSIKPRGPARRRKKISG